MSDIGFGLLKQGFKLELSLVNKKIRSDWDEEFY